MFQCTAHTHRPSWGPFGTTLLCALVIFCHVVVPCVSVSIFYFYYRLWTLTQDCVASAWWPACIAHPSGLVASFVGMNHHDRIVFSSSMSSHGLHVPPLGFAPVRGYGPGSVSVSNPLISLLPHGQSSISGDVPGTNIGTGPSRALLPLTRSLISAAPPGVGLSQTKETGRASGSDQHSEGDDWSDDSMASPDSNGRTPFQPVLSDSPGTHLNRQRHHQFFDQYR